MKKTDNLAFQFIGSACVAALLAGCKPAHDPAADEHAHEHGEKTAQITVWSESYEVFAEHKAPVVEKITTFITHVTDLNTLEPRREGPVTFTLQQGETRFEHTHPKPARAGIYLPGISFPKAGDWKVSLTIPAGGTNATVELGVVKVYGDDHAAAHAEMPEPPEGVSFLKEQQWKILSRVEPVTRRRVAQRVRAIAQVRPQPGQVAAVKPMLAGQLAAPNGQALLRPGQKVEAGQLLALLKPNLSEAGSRIVEARAEFNVAKASLEQAETAYNRVKKLAASQAKSERELQEAELAYQTAKTRYAAAQGLLATFRQAGDATQPDAPLVLEIRAPIAGVVSSVQTGIGDMVVPEQTLFTILDAEKVWLVARVTEANVSRLTGTKSAAMEVPGNPGEFASITDAGKGQFITMGMEVDEATRTVPVIYEVENRDGSLRMGQNISLHIETAHAQDAIVVPEAALVEEAGQLIAFVQLSGETFEKREVKIGIRDAGFVQVLEGIKEGERVVTKGAYAIRLSSISGVIPAHGHAH